MCPKWSSLTTDPQSIGFPRLLVWFSVIKALIAEPRAFYRDTPKASAKDAGWMEEDQENQEHLLGVLVLGAGGTGHLRARFILTWTEFTRKYELSILVESD